MKTLTRLLWFGLCILFFAMPAYGQTNYSIESDRKFTEFGQRLNNLESNWSRFQIGGSFLVKSDFELNRKPFPIGPPSLNQEMDLYLDATADPHLQLSLKLAQQGGWGLSYTSASSGVAPVTTPFQIDEAYAKWESTNSLNYLGRFRYSFGPFGLISDFIANPAEGVTLQHAIGHYHIAALYSRVNTQFSTGTQNVDRSEDYWAFRGGWSNNSMIAAFNIVPDGITGEKSFSFDFSLTKNDFRFATEIGWYSFHSAEYPDYQVGWTPGILVSFAQPIDKNNYFQFKVGYFSPQFAPSYSSLAHSSGNDREWFLPNSQGVEMLLQTQITKGLTWGNRVIWLVPVKPSGSIQDGYHFRSALARQFSATQQLEAGVDISAMFAAADPQLFFNWNVRF